MQHTSPKTHKTAVVLIPPEECWPPIQAIRQEHDRHVRRWMPHMTMIYPFRPKEQFATMAELFCTRASRSRFCWFSSCASGMASRVAL